MNLEKDGKDLKERNFGERHDLERLLAHAILTTFSRVLAGLI
jgi:hypothetical protein